jgi:hypothetical protein|tara:strand:+ start:327 stop:503 length:177 start_codon:yes stop_codon:yes gene_type:complete
LLEKLRKLIAERQQQLTETLAAGGVQDFESYQKIVGEISGLSFTETLISDLLKGKDEE